MKKILLATALVGASTSFAAEIAPTDPAADKSNYIAFGPAYTKLSYKFNGVNAKSSNGDPTNLGGITFDYGRYFGNSTVGCHEAGVFSELNYGTASAFGNDYTLTTFGIAAYYNYNFHVGSKTDIYLGARLGRTGVYSEVENGGSSSDASAGTNRIGIGFGVKQKFTEKFGMTFGLEYSEYSNFDLDYSGSLGSGTGKITDFSALQAKISFAWNF